jgi:hypothetical protein
MKLRNIVLFLMSLFLVAGCILQEDSEQILLTTTQQENRCVSSKVITKVYRETVTLYAASIPSFFSGLTNGSRTKYYNDGTYSGTLSSIGGTVYSPFYSVGYPRYNYYTGIVDITYRGTVSR